MQVLLVDVSVLELVVIDSVEDESDEEVRGTSVVPLVLHSPHKRGHSCLVRFPTIG